MIPEEKPDLAMLEAYIDCTAAVIGIPIAPYHPGVLTNMQRLQTLATLVMEFPLPDTVAVAPTFHP